MTQIDRAYGALVGSAIGDAMGMPASFLTRSQIEDTYDGPIEDFLTPAPEAQEAHGALEAGDVTDDTQESVIISRLLIRDGRFSADAFKDEMKQWAIEKDMLNTTVIGPSTRAFLTALINDEDPSEAAKLADTNGSAMRVAPIGIKYNYDMGMCVEAAAESSLISHGSRPAVAAACAVAAAVATGVLGNTDPEHVMQFAFDAAVYGERRGYEICAPSVSRRIKMAKQIVDGMKGAKLQHISDQLTGIFGASMKSYESVPLALGLFYAVRGDVKKGILAAVNAGDDADTNAAICGAICGAYSGVGFLPQEWCTRVIQSSGENFKETAKQLLRRS